MSNTLLVAFDGDAGDVGHVGKGVVGKVHACESGLVDFKVAVHLAGDGGSREGAASYPAHCAEVDVCNAAWPRPLVASQDLILKSSKELATEDVLKS